MSYTPIEYEVKFIAGDVVVSTQTYTIESKEITEPEVPDRKYYSGKWEQYDLNFENIVVYAVYTPKEYNVFFVGYYNEIINTAIYTVENTNIIEPEVPEREHYNGEWAAYELIGGDITVTPVYTPIEYKVIFMAKDEVISTQIYTVENMGIFIPAIPNIEGYTSEWEDYELLKDDITVVNAIYTPIPYTITFIANGLVVGNGKIVFTVETDSIDEPAVPSIAGYSGKWESYSLVCEDITVCAVYTIINYTITYENTKGAENPNYYSYNVDNVFELQDLSLDGYVFNGWYLNGEKINSVAAVYGDITLTAEWTPIEYTIIFTDEHWDKTIATVTYTVEDAEVTLPEVPEKEGYKGSWSEFKLTYDTEPLIVYAVYTKIEQ